MRFRLTLPTAAVLTMLSTSHAFAAPMVLACAPGQRVIVRETLVRGEPITRAECVNSGASRATQYTTRYRASRSHRSWGKTALIIGGGAGTGAGIGGIVHGKTGALIGAALGGGAASLYEGAHRR
jgi:hypothetical protein